MPEEKWDFSFDSLCWRSTNEISLMRFEWLDLWSLVCIRSSWSVAILTHYRHANKVVIYDSESRRSIARVVLQIDGASSGKRKFPRRYFLPILPWIYIPPPELSAGKDRPLTRWTSPDFISARYILPQRSLDLSGFKELELIYIKFKIRSIR